MIVDNSNNENKQNEVVATYIKCFKPPRVGPLFLDEQKRYLLVEILADSFVFSAFLRSVNVRITLHISRERNKL